MKTLVILTLLLFVAPCFAQDRWELTDRPTRHDLFNARLSRYYATPPKIYSGDGTYLGEFSTDRYAPDSISNKYGRYGSKYSSDSINNPYGNYNRYSWQRIYVYPGR